MAYDNFQNEPNLPNRGKSKRKSENHLPRIFRTPSNSKFLGSTLDQLIQPGVVGKLNGYVGRKTSKAYQSSDIYIGDVSQDRENYQLEPASVITDDLGNVSFYKDYNDYMNSLSNYNRSIQDHSTVNEQEFYAWNPFIDWDKFTNFREYYWLPSGPSTVSITGNSFDVESTYTVELSDNLDSYSYIFTPDGQTANPTLTLYRGVKYKFDVNVPNFPITFRTKLSDSSEFDLDSSTILLYDGVDIQGLETGTVTLELSTAAPDSLWYVAANDINMHGRIEVKDISDATEIDVDAEIVGKKTYTSGNGIALSNGIKISFAGNVLPASYSNKEYYVEGVGTAIKLIDANSLDVASAFTSEVIDEFDSEEFDSLPFSKALGYAKDKDYIVINRSATDGNLWARYNKWFHKSVIEASALANNLTASLDATQQATRPILEFEAGVRLYNYGTEAKTPIDLVDTITKDVFSTIEGSLGYNIDGVDLRDGHRILFTNDSDSLVKNRIFKVKFITYDGTVIDDANVSGQRQITLIEESDSISLADETVLVKQGTTYGGKTLHYKTNKWILGQEKTKVNQSPLFDLFDTNGYSFSDTAIYPSTTFVGNSIFAYKQGTGLNDTELGFPLAYRNITNVGDIVFESKLTTDTFTYVSNENVITEKAVSGFLHHHTDRSTFSNKTGWIKVTSSDQYVIRQFVFDNTFKNILIDQYDNSWDYVNDMQLIVYRNNSFQIRDVDYTVEQDATNFAKIVFVKKLVKDDVVVLKTKSSQVKNQNGYYEIPYSLERNPSNNQLDEFTLGEVNDHVATIIENTTGFTGINPGTNNLRDLGNVSINGRRFLQHSAPLNLPLYHITNDESNIIKSIKFAKNSYSKFKREFISVAETLGFQSDTKTHVDRILQEISKSQADTDLFYFSDMVPYGGFIKTDHPIEDSDEIYFPLGETFDKSVPSYRAVTVYLNDTQLVHGKDYTFNSEGYAVVTATKAPDDTITIYEYDSTKGNSIAPTPTKLGLYPAYEPKIFVDTTYQTDTKVIQGHDGSIIVAYDDYRDDLLLELEKRIYNNLKVSYNESEFNILEVKPSYYRSTSLSRESIDKSLLGDFFQWTKFVTIDYTSQTFSRENRFSYNYSESFDSKNNSLPGFWREIYKYYYDTDRPHTHPWEMLGETIEPTWWQDTYGAAPYTSDNLLMWEDIEAGIVKTPGQRIEYRSNYKRSGLSNIIPVDEHGDLVSPLEIGLVSNYNFNLIERPWVFGDGAPVEAAWRRSSEYPFAALVAFALNKPCKLFGTGFDKINQVRNLAGNLIYKPTGQRIRLEDIVFPMSKSDTTDVFTSGVINYIAEYVKSNVESTYTDYKNNVQSLTNQLGFKLAGFTDKTKLKLILDSRTPLNKGNVFVPEENYKIIINESSPVELLNYSGVIIEKIAEGFLIKGYSSNRSYFLTYPILSRKSDFAINVGGVSEPFVEWVSGNFYTAGTIVRNNSAFYRCSKDNKETEFSEVNFSPLAELPIEGGRDAIISTQFNKSKVVEVPYGTLFTEIQDVVDFLLGYEAYLLSKGFVFDFFDNTINKVLDWKHSIQEFLFWTLYNLDSGAAISLSPSASYLQLASNSTIVSNILTGPNDYTLLQADGSYLDIENTTLSRLDNDFVMFINPDVTGQGVFYVELPMTQTEHVVLLDNETVFNDIIYDKTPGYRQERIKLLGYRTEEWTGSTNIPGFIYSDATAAEWKQNVPYDIGTLVKHKQFYYVADVKVAPSTVFNDAEWIKLSEQPRQGLFPNFEYKTNQFTDFYDLDSDNLDTEQQRFAQHLIGYQKRDYLENIINNSVSQYKFYQGMILEKGTSNALSKLFDVLASSDKDSLEFYEEWAIRDGQYGGVDIFDEFEAPIDESKILANPQPILLTNQSSEFTSDVVYRLKPFEVSVPTKNYDNNPFPTKVVVDTFTNSPGYVHKEDVVKIVDTMDDLVGTKIKTVRRNEFVWAGKEGLSWSVNRHIRADVDIASINVGSTIKITTNNLIKDIEKDDIVGIHSVYGISSQAELLEDSSKLQTTIKKFSEFDFFAKVVSVENAILELEIPEASRDAVGSLTGAISNAELTRFEPARFANTADANTAMQNYFQPNTKLWIDKIGTNSEWKVLTNDNLYTEAEIFDGPSTADDSSFTKSSTFATAITANNSGNVLCVGDPNSLNGIVYVYRRAGKNKKWVFNQYLTPADYAADGQAFGSSIELSEDGQWLIVGSPKASNVKSKFKNAFSNTTTYAKNEIVSYKNRLWRAKFDLLYSSAGVNFNTFSSTVQNIYALENQTNSNADVPVIYVGNYSIPSGTATAPFTDTVNHILVRAPKTLYDNTITEDSTGNWEIKLDWNTLSYGYQDVLLPTATQPFNGNYSVLNESFFDGTHAIRRSIDTVIYFDSLTVVPELGETVQTDTGTAEIDYVHSNTDGKYVVYLRSKTGSFNSTDSLYRVSGEYIGDFEKQADADGTVYGGFWWIDTPNYTPAYSSTLSDQGRGLVYVDMANDSTFGNTYHNILDNNTTVIDSENNKNSYIRVLTSDGFPNANNANGTILDSRYVVRAPKALTDTLSVSDTVNLYVNQLPNYSAGLQKDITDIGLTTADTNKEVSVAGLWDGYIGLRFTKFQTNGQPYIPQVGQTVRDKRTGATAKVQFIQRNYLDATLFVSDVTGAWSKGESYSDLSEIEFLAISGGSGIYQVDREIGDIQHVSVGSATIGKLIVVDTGTDISLPTQQILEGAEYWFYTNRQVLGDPRAQEAPSISNSDWEVVYNIPVDTAGTASSFTNQGVYSVYKNDGTAFSEYGSYIVQDAQTDSNLGANVKIRKKGDTYKAFVQAAGNGTAALPGKIYFFNKGIYETVSYDWESSKFKSYKGPFDESLAYRQGDIVFVSEDRDALYEARLNIVAGTAFSLDNWTKKSDYVDYVGFIPNNTNIVVINDSTDFSSVLDNDNVETFGDEFDVSKDGAVVVSKVTYENKPSTVVVYRNVDENYQHSQIVIAGDESSAINEWKTAISSDGMFIAISKPLEDIYQSNEGQVFIYKQVNGEFTLDHTLENSNYKNGEQFGYNIDFDGNRLLVSAKNSDAVTPTIFDNSQTYFDSGFTNFSYTNEFQGIVYVYENVDNEYLLAQKLNAKDQNLRDFGKHVLLKNNDIFIGIPIKPQTYTGTNIGEVYNFKITDSSKNMWRTLREIQSTVDLEKIKEVYLYNTKTNTRIANLDYIDINQGKISGLADQEINYKTNDDPAVYSVGLDTDNVDVNNTWGSEQVGQVWWDLTNAKFYNPYQSEIIYSAQTWNTAFGSSSVDVYEWIESPYLPSKYNELSKAGNAEAIRNGITGTAKTESTYVSRKVYDTIAKTFSNKYYYWVKDKTTIPVQSDRNFSVKAISSYIADPNNNGVESISFLSADRFVLNNVNKYLSAKDVSLNVQFYNQENTDVNVHTQYKIISENLETSQPTDDVITKWFDSLIGYDSNLLPVPDTSIPTKYRYGNLSKPRQSWFVNRLEALKQVVERINLVLKDTLIVDSKTLTPLFDTDPAPAASSNLYDESVDDLEDLADIQTEKLIPAILTPVVENGKITKVEITNPGRGYKNAPPVIVYGKGSDAEVNVTVDSLGRVRTATVVKQGTNYLSDTILTIRKYAVLVKNDSTISNKWAIYERDGESWIRKSKQKYDTTLYWNYIDWYAAGFNANTRIDHIVSNSHGLINANINRNEIVKIQNVGSGGWLLLKRKDVTNSLDYTIDYDTIGREKGTIEFGSNLYEPPSFGFDSNSFDIKFYDFLPVYELRTILSAIKDNIFVNDLLLEFNRLFFASLRYVLSEQTNTDWLFKTSFVKAKHNVGQLRQDITFNNDNLADYEEYIKEVKPFKSKIREYLSSYERLEPTNSFVTDFDLTPVYDAQDGKLIHADTKIVDNEITVLDEIIENYPNKHWANNNGYEVTAVHINNAGSKYRTAPVVKLSGGGGTGAEIKTYVGTSGKITKVEIVNPGSGYTSAPSIELLHNIEEGGTNGEISLEIGNGLVRSTKTAMKFDRTAGSFTITDINVEETFTSSGSKFEYDLKWPIVLTRDKISVKANGIELGKSEYSFSNVVDTSKSYKRSKGRITTTSALSNGTIVTIAYEKSLDILNAADRINAYYTPATGQLGKDLTQLMVGVDYGGVEVKGVGFETIQGWDNDAWYTSEWDAYTDTNEDEVFQFDESTVEINLSKPLELGTSYNVYLNQVRIDDPNYDGSTAIDNPNAIMRTLVGDGVTTTMYLDDFKLQTIQSDGNNTGAVINYDTSDKLIIRKSSSDGTYALNPNTIDTQLSGGNLAYGNARGISSEDITIDGDNFVSHITSGSVEEHVPGQVLDTLNIKVYERPSGSNSNITSNIFYGNGTTTDFTIDANLYEITQVIVSVDGNLQRLTSDYTVDVDTKTVQFVTAPAARSVIRINDFGLAGSNIIESDTFTSDGSTLNILTGVSHEDDLQSVARVDGADIDHEIVNQDGRAVISLAEAAVFNDVVQYAIFKPADTSNYSKIIIENITADGSSVSYDLSNKPAVKNPLEWNTVVIAGNTLLDPGYAQKFTMDDSTRSFVLNNSQIDLNNIPGYSLYVVADDSVLEFNKDYTWTPETGTIHLSAVFDLTGKQTLEVYTRHNADYTFGTFDTGNDFGIDSDTITFTSTYSESTLLKVITFANHDHRNINRQRITVKDRSGVDTTSNDYNVLTNIQRGRILLDTAVVDAQYVWVSKNGQLLTPNGDYSINATGSSIELASQPSLNDEFLVVHFAADPLRDTFGWQQFKDILNRTHYQSLDSSKAFKLSNDLKWYDKKIVLDDASALSEPDADGTPGVIWIDGERIEYFVKADNELSQLRRGTLGTGVKGIYSAGTSGIEVSGANNVPYKDELYTTVYTGDGTADEFVLDFTPSSSNEFEVFVGGKRLRKNSISSYRFEYTDGNGTVVDSIAMDSPEGDVTLPAEFSYSGTTLTLASVPADSVKVVVIRKKGLTWSDAGKTLSESQTDIAKFLRSTTVDLPR